MKVMSKAKIFEFNIEHQMANEIEIMSLLDHPNIIKLEYYFETKEELILILEFAVNGTLFKLIKERQKCLKHGSKSQPILNEAKIGKVSLKI
jgi:serine/threonine protein kinase